MKGPLYFLLVRDDKQPANIRLSRAPAVWLYLAGNTVWGLLCTIFIRHGGNVTNLGAVILISFLIAVLSIPTITARLYLQNKAGEKITFEDILAAVTIGALYSWFTGGFVLRMFLYFLGVRYMFGFPID